jgi:hypothetical protein
MCLRRAPEKYIAGAALDRAVLNDRAVLPSEKPPPHINNPQLSGNNNILVIQPRWVPDTKTDWPTVIGQASTDGITFLCMWMPARLPGARSSIANILLLHRFRSIRELQRFELWIAGFASDVSPSTVKPAWTANFDCHYFPMSETL